MSSSETGIVTENFNILSETLDIILDQDRLYLGGAPNAFSSCGNFQRIFVSPTTSSSTIPNMDVLRFGYSGTTKLFFPEF